MQHMFFNKILRIVLCTASLGYASISGAHSGGATMDPSNSVRSFTGFALITCFDDGNGPADNLIANIKDTSAPHSNLLVNLQVISPKRDRAISITDTVSGDAEPSPWVTLHGGNGSYLLLVNKTDAGARSFVIDYHCITASGVHTGTDITVKQFE